MWKIISVSLLPRVISGCLEIGRTDIVCRAHSRKYIKYRYAFLSWLFCATYKHWSKYIEQMKTRTSSNSFLYTDSTVWNSVGQQQLKIQRKSAAQIEPWSRKKWLIVLCFCVQRTETFSQVTLWEPCRLRHYIAKPANERKWERLWKGWDKEL